MVLIKTDPPNGNIFSGIPANVAALLPFTSDPSSHSSSTHTVPPAAVASQAPTTPALAINHEQLAALAKFASNSQTRSGEHDFSPFPPPPPPPPPHPIPSAVTFQSQSYIPPPKPFSPPTAAARYPASSRDRDPRERDRYSRYADKQNGGRDSRLVAQSMSSSSSSPDKHRQNDNWRAGRQGGGGEKRSRSRSPDRRTNGHRLNMSNRSAISSLPNLPPPPPPPALLPISSQQSRRMDNPSITATATTARLGQGRGIVEGDGEEDMALDVSDEEERARPGPTVAQPAYPPSTVPPPYLSAPPPVAPPFPPPSSASAPQHQQQQQTPISISSSLQPTNRQNDLVTLHTFPLQTFDPSSADSWAKLGEAWQNSTGREPEQIELMHWLATGQVMDFKMMRMGMGMGMGMGMDMDMGMGMMDMNHENGDSSSHVSQGDMNGLSSSATAHSATGLLPPSHLSMRGDQWSHTQGQAQGGDNDSWRQQGQGY